MRVALARQKNFKILRWIVGSAQFGVGKPSPSVARREEPSTKPAGSKTSRILFSIGCELCHFGAIEQEISKYSQGRAAARIRHMPQRASDICGT